MASKHLQPAKRKRRTKKREVPLSAKQKKLAGSIIEQSQRYTATPYGHSRWSAFQKCETEHYLRIHKRVRPRMQPEAPEIGTAVHIGLCAQELAAFHGLKAQIWQEAIRTCGRPPDVISEAHRLLSGYFLRFGLDNAGWKDARILGVEQYASIGQSTSAAGASRIDDLHWSTRYDLVLEMRLPGSDDLETVVVDHKTRKNRIYHPDEFAKHCHANPQFIGHALTWRERYGSIPVVMVNALIKTKVPEYGRVAIRFSDEELDRWSDNQREIERRRLPLMEDPDHIPLMNYDACVPPIGSPCWALDWCHGSKKDREESYDVLTEENYESIVHSR